MRSLGQALLAETGREGARKTKVLFARRRRAKRTQNSIFSIFRGKPHPTPGPSEGAGPRPFRAHNVWRLALVRLAQVEGLGG